jgi:hypothetical protein
MGREAKLKKLQSEVWTKKAVQSSSLGCGICVLIQALYIQPQWLLSWQCEDSKQHIQYIFDLFLPSLIMIN